MGSPIVVYNGKLSGLLSCARLNCVVLESGEPVTVIEWVPTGAEGVTVKVIVEEQVGLQGLFDTEAVTPEGRPETVSVTG